MARCFRVTQYLLVKVYINISCPGAITLPGPEAFESLRRYFRAKAYINSGRGFQFWTRDGTSLYKTLQTYLLLGDGKTNTHVFRSYSLLILSRNRLRDAFVRHLGESSKVGIEMTCSELSTDTVK